MTARLLLRPPGEEHGASIARALRRNAEHLARLTPRGGPPPWSLVEVAVRVAHERLEFQRGVAFAFYVFARPPAGAPEPSDVLGKVALRRATSEDRESDLGYWIDTAHEGRGLAHEAVREVVRFAMEDRNLHTLRAHIRPCNIRSVALAGRLGFRAESEPAPGDHEPRAAYVLAKDDWLYRAE